MTRPAEQRRVLALALLLAALTGGMASGQESAERLEGGSLTDADQLVRGRQAFLNGDYAGALRALEQVDPRELGRDQRIQLHEMMGKSYFIVGYEAAAEEQFFEVLKLDKGHEMDPVSTPRKIRDLFIYTRGKRERELRLFPVEPERTIPGRDTPMVASYNMFVAFAPAGIFRLAFLHTPRKGTGLLLAQLLPLGASVGSSFYLSWAFDGRLHHTAVANAWPVFWMVNFISAAVAWIVYAVGIVDAFASQRYHGPTPGGRKGRKVAERWRWGPPIPCRAAPD